MDRDVAARLAEAKPDVVFNALHGAPGEDGTVQGMMDLMGLPYTHSGLATSVIAIDKELTKHALVPHGIPMPGGRIVESEELYERDPLARPYVLKPVNEGSSVGVAIVTDEGNYGNPISARRRRARGRSSTACSPSRYIRGRELTAAVLGDRALLVTELKPKSGFYDFDAKYTDGMTEHVCPARDPRRDRPKLCKDYRAAGAPPARLPRHQPLGLPLGRRAGRGRAVPARDQHPAGHDPAQPGARAGASTAAWTTPSWSRRSSTRRWRTSASWRDAGGRLMAQTISRNAKPARRQAPRAGHARPRSRKAKAQDQLG